MLTGSALLCDARYNKGTAFTRKERIELKLEGLLPPHVSTQDEQVQRCFLHLDSCHTDLERYQCMQDLANRNRTLFFRVLQDRLVELLPIVYTPTVGKAVRVCFSDLGIFTNLSLNFSSHLNYLVALHDISSSAKSLGTFFVNRKVSTYPSNKRVAFDRF